VPRVYITSTAAPGYTHEPFELRVAGVIYTMVVSTTADVFVPQEHIAPLTSALAAADSNCTLHTRSE
jgi:hypothetical protein